MIEICGVLAAIAILVSILIPMVFNAISVARVNNAALSIGTVKTACIEHFAKFGGLALDGTMIPPCQIPLEINDPRASDFDLQLLKEGLLDKPFTVKIGYGYVEIATALEPDEAPDGENCAYDLDGSGTANDAAGSVVAQAVIVDVTREDARALNDLIDGPALGEQGGNDYRGRVKYSGTSPGNGANNGNPGGNGHGKAWAWGHRRSTTPNVYVYLTHR